MIPVETVNTSDGEDDASLLEEKDTVAKDEEETDEEDKLSKEKTKEDEEDKEDKEDEEDEPVKILFDRPTFKEIKTKYPEFFKDFPSLRDAFFREAEFTRIFPTIEDARESFEDNEAFVSLRESVLSGDSATLMEAIEKSDVKAFETFSHSFLPTLYKRNSEMYTEIVTPILENLVRQAFQSGTRSGNEDLKNAALHVSQFLFGDSEVAQGTKRVSKDRASTEDTKTKEDKERKSVEAFQHAYASVSEDVNRSLSSLIRKDFDPDEVFTSFQKRLLVTEIVSKIGSQLEKDKGHMAVMNARWKRAGLDGFSDDSKSKLITAYLARAKSLIPSIRQAVRSAALGSKEKSDKTKEERAQPPKKEVVGGRVPSSSKSVEKADYRKMSDLDILNAD